MGKAYELTSDLKLPIVKSGRFRAAKDVLAAIESIHRRIIGGPRPRLKNVTPEWYLVFNLEALANAGPKGAEIVGHMLEIPLQFFQMFAGVPRPDVHGDEIDDFCFEFVEMLRFCVRARLRGSGKLTRFLPNLGGDLSFLGRQEVARRELEARPHSDFLEWKTPVADTYEVNLNENVDFAAALRHVAASAPSGNWVYSARKRLLFAFDEEGDFDPALTENCRAAIARPEESDETFERALHSLCEDYMLRFVGTTIGVMQPAPDHIFEALRPMVEGRPDMKGFKVFIPPYYKPAHIAKYLGKDFAPLRLALDHDRVFGGEHLKVNRVRPTRMSTAESKGYVQFIVRTLLGSGKPKAFALRAASTLTNWTALTMKKGGITVSDKQLRDYKAAPAVLRSDAIAALKGALRTDAEKTAYLRMVFRLGISG